MIASLDGLAVHFQQMKPVGNDRHTSHPGMEHVLLQFIQKIQERRTTMIDLLQEHVYPELQGLDPEEAEIRKQQTLNEAIERQATMTSIRRQELAENVNSWWEKHKFLTPYNKGQTLTKFLDTAEKTLNLNSDASAILLRKVTEFSRDTRGVLLDLLDSLPETENLKKNFTKYLQESAHPISEELRRYCQECYQYSVDTTV